MTVIFIVKLLLDNRYVHYLPHLGFFTDKSKAQGLVDELNEKNEGKGEQYEVIPVTQG